jgi:DNA-binding SARP family transcriptional activator
MAQLRLYAFGPPRLECDARPVDLGLRKGLALIVYLAVTAQPHSRDHLAALLWPESDQREARTRLRRLLHRLGEALGDAVLDLERDTVRLAVQLELWLDCAEFRAHVTKGLPAAPAEALTSARVGHLVRAIELYTAEFLAGFSLPDSAAFEEWQFFQRESLHQLFGQSLEQLVQANLAGGRIAEALPFARRWVARDPLHEPAQRTLIPLDTRRSRDTWRRGYARTARSAGQ